MSPVRLDKDVLDAITLGGAFYGGGGGGPITQGVELGQLALQYGNPTMISIDEMPGDAILLTVSAVGAPAAQGQHAKAYHYVRAVELFIKYSGIEVHGFISNECGGLASVNGWIQSAAFGLPVVDAPCDGRAHPTGIMGSMGLRWPEYTSLQAACGGSRSEGTYVEIFTTGSPEKTAALVRQAAVQAGGLVAVARNPVEASYVRSHGAPGSLEKCIKVGRAMLDAKTRGPLEMAQAAAATADGKVMFTARVSKKDLETVGGFDVGQITFDNGAQVVFWNEYITLDMGAERLATFPDLIATISTESGVPLSSTDIVPDSEVAVVVVPKGHLILGAGVKDKSLFYAVEEATGQRIIEYVFK
ncbi:MAG: DUF917 family protein [Firmicutes bacterium]|nr:DUF917 family protein [Bacillota bacterium]